MGELRGIYRIPAIGKLAPEVKLDDGVAPPYYVTEGKYRAGGYEPPFEALPWKEEYETRKGPVR